MTPIGKPVVGPVQRQARRRLSAHVVERGVRRVEQLAVVVLGRIAGLVEPLDGLRRQREGRGQERVVRLQPGDDLPGRGLEELHRRGQVDRGGRGCRARASTGCWPAAAARRSGGIGAAAMPLDQMTLNCGSSACGNGLAMSTTSWPSHSSSRRLLPRRDGVGPGRDAVEVGPRPAGDPQPTGLAADPLGERDRRHRAAGACRRASGRAMTSSSAAASRTVRAQRPVAREPAPVRSGRPDADPSPAGLEAEDAARAGRDADRSATVAALRERHEPGGDGRRRAAAGTAGVAGHVPGVRAGPMRSLSV